MREVDRFESYIDLFRYQGLGQGWNKPIILNFQISVNQDLDMNIIFCNAMHIKNNDHEGRIIISHQIDFNGISSYNGITNRKITFKNIVFEQELLNLEYLGNFNVDFENCIFKKKFNIIAIEKYFVNPLLLINCYFEGVFQLGGTFAYIDLHQSFFKELSINDCTFQKTNFNSIHSQKTTIQGTTFNTSFQCLGSILMDFIMINSTFIEECLFYEKSMMSTYGISGLFGNNDNDNNKIINNTFKKKADFTKCELDKVKFTNSTFEDKAIF